MRSYLLLTIVLIAAGCERTPTARPATQPTGDAQVSSARIEAANPPATQPVERAPSVVLIDQKPRNFPPAILQLRNRDGQLVAVLMSDDPKSAIDDNYHGNSFYLEMPLEISDAKDLPGYVYRYVAPTSERTDAPDGIFLDGTRLQLQPQNVQAKFDGDEGSLVVIVSGQFLEFETREETTLPQRVSVIAKLAVEVKRK